MNTTTEAPEQITTDTAAAPLPALEVPLSVATQSAAAMLTSASKDDVTPVITAAHFDGAELWATDRYKVARFPMPTRPAKDDDRLELGSEFLIPRAALEWVAKIAPKSLRFKAALATMTDNGYTIRYEHEHPESQPVNREYPGTVTASVVDMNGKTERSQAFDGVAGNFPPVARLFPAEDAQPAAMTQAFNPSYMIEILNYCKKYGNSAPFKITTYGDGANRMSPALIEGAGASFLLQPNLILR